MLQLRLGDLVAWDGAEYVVAAATAHATLLRRLEDGLGLWVDLPTLSASGELTVVQKQHPDDAQSAEVDSLTAQDIERARWWESHLREVLYGVADPDDPAAVPRPGYGDPSKTARRAVKAEELTAAGITVSARTLGRKEKQYLAHGIYGLIDRRRTTTPSCMPRIDQDVADAITTVLEDMTTGSTVTVSTLINRVRALLAHRHGPGPVTMPSDRTLRRAIDAYDARGIARGKATTRRSASRRPNRGPAPVIATAPGQITEIDSTPVNVQCVMPSGALGRPALTVLMDVTTRSILGFSMVPQGASGVEHADLLARVLRPRPCRPGAPEWMRLESSPVLPHEQMAAVDERQHGAIAVPYIVPESITTDRGKDYLGATFVAACRHFGISVRQAPPQSPTFKTHVERLLGAVETMWMQKQPGYIGSDPTRRGDVDAAALLTLTELADSFERWWVRVWQNRPHDGLRDRDLPARRFSPNQMYAAMFDASAGLPVPIDEYTYINLMPVRRRKLHPGIGFKVDHLHYWSDQLTSLVSSRPHTRDDKWPVHCDPYDRARVWVVHPQTGDFIECVSGSYRLDAFPFASALRHLRSTDPADADVQNMWAEQLLADRVNSPRTRADKQRSVTDQRARDGDPRPAPIADPEPPTPSANPHCPDEFRVVSPDEELWNAT